MMEKVRVTAMDKVLQRAKRVAQNAGRAKQRATKVQEKGQRQERNDRRRVQLRHQNDAIRRAQHERREQWALGPLAPRRDVGDNAETYGAEMPFFAHVAAREARDRPEWQNIYPGDRVVMLRGHDRGRIGEVQTYHDDAATVTIKGLNVIDVAAPDFLLSSTGSDEKTRIVPFDRQVPIEDVRLVYPLPHPETGAVRDVIVERLERVDVPGEQDAKQADSKTKRGYRAIPGTNTIIPWPVEAEEPSPDEHDGDTVRIDVDDVSHVPTLMYYPMQKSVLDELRNKYSRFRTRHDPEFRDKMAAIDERDERRDGLIEVMRTPLQELARLQAKKKQAEERVLSDADLAEIGRIMAAQDVPRSDMHRENNASAGS